jgi:hypothetical protein
MKNIIIIILSICSLSSSIAQSKKEIIQELTIENSYLKQKNLELNEKNSELNEKINLLDKVILDLRKELEVDKVETPQEFGKTLFNLFISQRLSKYPELQFQMKDTIYLHSRSVDTIKQRIIKIQKNFLEFYLEGINKGIDWNEAKYDRFEFEISEPNEETKINNLLGRFYFTFKGNKYSFENGASILENGKWRGYIFSDLVNESEELENEKKAKQERLNGPYKPRGVKFGNIVYSYNSKEVNPKTMYGLRIPIENNTPYTIEEIKFQFRIYENEKLILSKNITVGEYLYYRFDSKLESGEKEIIELHDLGDIFIGSGVKNNKWTYEVELLEVSPKPAEN